MRKGEPDNIHGAFVDAWLARRGRGGAFSSPEPVLQLFDAGLAAVWREAQESLGEVTLAAIASRVLHVGRERFPLLTPVVVGESGISVGPLRERAGGGAARDLLEALRFLLAELLRVLGQLTAEVMTPWLHAELSKVGVEE